jgi:hypothetical protein
LGDTKNKFLWETKEEEGGFYTNTNQHKMCRFCINASFGSPEYFKKNLLSAKMRNTYGTHSHKFRGKCLQSPIDSDNSTHKFHGFTSPLTCGRVLNTQYAPNTYSATYVGEVLGFGSLIYLALFYFSASVCLQIWVCCPYNTNTKYLCCCQVCISCCEKENDESDIDNNNNGTVKQINHFSRRRSSIKQTTVSFCTIAVPPNSNGKTIIVNNLMIKIPMNAEPGKRITVAVPNNATNNVCHNGTRRAEI